jgi:hypothetical protein
MVVYCSSQPTTPSFFFITNIKMADIKLINTLKNCSIQCREDATFVERKMLNYSKRIFKDKTRTFVQIVLIYRRICCPSIFLFDIFSRLIGVLVTNIKYRTQDRNPSRNSMAKDGWLFLK